ncbi:MAG: nucleoside deaminase [Chlamydiae bacterium]|nr:nucleoside deaminase [Chlamydiota bacterium]
MQEALMEAKKAFQQGEVPVGAVAVLHGKIIGRAHNLVEKLQDASAHAELLCLQRAAASLGNWRLLGVTLYTTLEPCCLCTGALYAFRIQRIVWGAADKRLGADGSFVSLLSVPHPLHTVEVTRNILAKESGELMTTFFQQRRKQHAQDVG